jgi:hypothetical protein
MNDLDVPVPAPSYAEQGARVRLPFTYRPGDEIYVLAGSARAERARARPAS